VTFGSSTLSAFVEQLGSSAPVPGGGGASAVTGALAAGLVSMVAELSVGRPRYLPYAGTIASAGADGRRFAQELLDLADRDADSMVALLEASRLPRGTEAERDARVSAVGLAARTACLAPQRILELCQDVGTAAERLAGRSNQGLASDLVVASRLVEGAAHGAAENVLVNLPSWTDRDGAEALASDVRGNVASVVRLARATRRHVAAHRLRKPERAVLSANSSSAEPLEAMG
jgi:methenyltetrahydrofolate cyclohydrolase